jgi:hypothetical protein
MQIRRRKEANPKENLRVHLLDFWVKEIVDD